jgi:hypothetical protein
MSSLLNRQALKEIVSGQQLESKMFTIDENTYLLLESWNIVKCLMLGGGDETCKVTGSNASYIIKCKYRQKSISIYTTRINQSNW